jgi:hypothetical protein
MPASDYTELSKTPDDVKSYFKTILDSVADGSAVLMCGRTYEGGPMHYMVARVDAVAETLIPIAYLPCGETLMHFLHVRDDLVKKFGGPEADPDFTGVRQ